MAHNPFANHRIPGCTEILGTIGDVDAVTYGGGVVYRHEQGHIVFAYTHGVESAVTETGYTAPKIAVYWTSVEQNVKSELDWADWDEVQCELPEGGKSLDELLRSDDPMDWAQLYRLVADRYGWKNLDDYPQKYTETALRLRWYGEEPDEDAAERESLRNKADSLTQSVWSEFPAMRLFVDAGEVRNLMKFVQEIDKMIGWYPHDTQREHEREALTNLASIREWALRESTI